MVHSSPRVDAMEVKEFCLDDVQGSLCTTQKVTIPPFSTVSVHGNIGVRGHCMSVHVLAEPMADPKLPTTMGLTVTYGELHPESSWVPICLCNLSANSVKIPTKMVVGLVMPANQVPLETLLTVKLEESISNPHKRVDPGGPGPPRSEGMA